MNSYVCLCTWKQRIMTIDCFSVAVDCIIVHHCDEMQSADYRHKRGVHIGMIWNPLFDIFSDIHIYQMKNGKIQELITLVSFAFSSYSMFINGFICFESFLNKRLACARKEIPYKCICLCNSIIKLIFI